MKALAVEFAELLRADIRTRLPFRYGIATMVDVPHVFLRINLCTPAGSFPGMAADHLPPKWFTKDPVCPIPKEIDSMLAVILHAASVSLGITAPDPFRFWQALRARQAEWGRLQGHPPLLAHFGSSLVERALIDAFARSRKSNFHCLLHTGALGISLDEVHAPLRGMSPADLLPGTVAESVFCRHTVGLADPVRETDIAENIRVDDGLPQSLEAGIRRYGLRHFKIKIDGANPDAAIARLQAVLSVLAEREIDDMAFSLDGNESFPSTAALRDFWSRLQGDPVVRRFLRHLLFIEQPLSRGIALDPEETDFTGWMDRPPIIIDESDGDIGDLPVALRLGYAGTSHKNCKGIFKGVANACLIAQRRNSDPGRKWILSGEDLCNIGPVALLQDLAVQGVLGVSSVERNGHHYFAGLSPWPEEVQASVLESHPDLYERTPAGWPTLQIREGRISTRSVTTAPLGIAVHPPLDRIPGRKIPPPGNFTSSS